MEREEGREELRRPVSLLSIILLFLIIAVTVFLVIIQNVDRFSDFFGSTTLRIMTDLGLLAFILLFAAYIFTRNSAYHRRLESLVHRLRKSNQLLQALNTVQSKANSTLDMDELLETAVSEVMPLVSSIGIVYLLDEEKGLLVPQATYGIDSPVEKLPGFPMGEGIVGKAAQSRRIIVDQSSAGGEPSAITARMAVPISAGNKLMGVMVAGKRDGGFPEEEQTLMHAICEVLGNSLTNAKLYQITRRALDMSRKNLAYLESFINAASAGIVIVDEVGNVFLVNREAENLLGLSRKEMVGKNLRNFFGGEHGPRKRMAENLEECLKGGNRMQWRENGDEGVPPCTIDLFPISREEGKVMGAAMIISR